MSTQETLSIIKPDAMELKYSGKIIDFIEDKGFEIIAQKKIILTKVLTVSIIAIKPRVISSY